MKAEVEELKVRKAEKLLVVRFSDQTVVELPFELLRVESPSAEVQGHGPDQKQLVAGRMHVGITGIEPVGHYAVRIIFDDLHDTGIYTWDYFYWLGLHQDQIWADYEENLAKAGLSRDPKLNPPAPPKMGCGGGSGGGCG